MDMKTREQYKEEALRVMQDVEYVADLLEDKDEAERVYCNGKSIVAYMTICNLIPELNEASRNELENLLGSKAVDEAIDRAVKFLIKMGFTHIREFRKAMKGE